MFSSDAPVPRLFPFGWVVQIAAPSQVGNRIHPKDLPCWWYEPTSRGNAESPWLIVFFWGGVMKKGIYHNYLAITTNNMDGEFIMALHSQ